MCLGWGSHPTHSVRPQACDTQGKHEVIWSLIDSMPQLGVEPNIVNYNTALRALCRAGGNQWQSVAISGNQWQSGGLLEKTYS